jgi:hypothetical protein
MSGPARRRRGRPPACPPEVLDLVLSLHRQRLSLAKISAVMNAYGIPTPGNLPRWEKCHVDWLLHTRHARERMTQLSQPTQPAVRQERGHRDQTQMSRHTITSPINDPHDHSRARW